MSKRLAECQRVIGYAFADLNLLEVALTHSSVRTPDRECNERQEFLGDSVLGLVITEELYRRLPDQQEGELTRIKSAVVSRGALYRVSTKLGLTRFVEVAKGVARREELPVSLTANLVESIIGALYLDGGFYPAREFVLRHLGPEIEDVFNDRVPKNFKSLLQQEAQSLLNATPVYKTVEEEGPDHRKHFIVAAIIKGTEYGRASGVNKREAEQEAARHALEAIKYSGRRRRRRLPELRDPRDRHRDRVRSIVGQSRDADDWREWAETNSKAVDKPSGPTGPTEYAIGPEADEGFVDEPVTREVGPDSLVEGHGSRAEGHGGRISGEADGDAGVEFAEPAGPTERGPRGHAPSRPPSRMPRGRVSRPVEAAEPTGPAESMSEGDAPEGSGADASGEERPRRRGRRGRRGGRGGRGRDERGAAPSDAGTAPGEGEGNGLPDGGPEGAPGGRRPASDGSRASDSAFESAPFLDPGMTEIPLAFMEQAEPASWPDGPGDPDPSSSPSLPPTTRRPRRSGGARAPRGAAEGRTPRNRSGDEPLLPTRGPAEIEPPRRAPRSRGEPKPPAGASPLVPPPTSPSPPSRPPSSSRPIGSPPASGPGFGAGVVGEGKGERAPARSAEPPVPPPVASVEARRKAPQTADKKPQGDGGFGVGL